MTTEQIKIVIMYAHIAGQRSAGVDASNYEALAYYESLIKNLTIHEVVISFCPNCSSKNIDAVAGEVTYQCNDCYHVWGH